MGGVSPIVDEHESSARCEKVELAEAKDVSWPGLGPRSCRNADVEPGAEATGDAPSDGSDMPPDGGYGWVCAACVFLVNVNTWGLGSTWGIFMDRFMDEDTYPGTTELHYALIGGLSISCSLLMAPLVGPSQKILGMRGTLLLGALIIAAGLLASSTITAAWQLFLTQGLCFGAGMGLIYIPAMALLPPWFSSHRSLAVGLATSGAGLGGVAYSLITGRVVRDLGIAWAYRVLSLCGLVMNLACAFLLKERPPSSSATSKPRRRSFHARDFLRTPIVLVVLWGFLTEFGYVALFYSLPSYATSVGLTPTQGSVVQALLNLGIGTGRPLIGLVSDRVGRINVALGLALSCGILCLGFWIPARSYGALLAFAYAAGIGAGSFWATVGPILAEVVGLHEAGGMFGAICFTLVIPTTFGEAIALHLVEGSGTGVGVRTAAKAYLGAQVYIGGTTLAGAMALWILRNWKLREMERESARAEDSEALGASQDDMSIEMLLDVISPKRLLMPKHV